jgi:hypothetical protein
MNPKDIPYGVPESPSGSQPQAPARKRLHIIVCKNGIPHGNMFACLEGTDASLVLQALSSKVHNECGPHRVEVYELVEKGR